MKSLVDDPVTYFHSSTAREESVPLCVACYVLCKVGEEAGKTVLEASQHIFFPEHLIVVCDDR